MGRTKSYVISEGLKKYIRKLGAHMGIIRKNTFSYTILLKATSKNPQDAPIHCFHCFGFCCHAYRGCSRWRLLLQEILQKTCSPCPCHENCSCLQSCRSCSRSKGFHNFGWTCC